MTATRQRNAVSEGMALGLVLCGTTSIPSDKTSVDLAFTAAWRNWGYRARFPQVDTDLSKGLDGDRAMTRASEGKHVWVLYWDTSGKELTIWARQPDWDPNSEDDLAYALDVIDGGVPAAGWVELAQQFLRAMEE